MFLIYLIEVPDFGYHMLIRGRSEIVRKSRVFDIFAQSAKLWASYADKRKVGNKSEITCF